MIKKRGRKAFLSEKHPSNFEIKVLHKVVIKISLHEQKLGWISGTTGSADHKVVTFTEHHSVCPLVGIWDSSNPSLAIECASPPGTKGGGGSLAHG